MHPLPVGPRLGSSFSSVAVLVVRPFSPRVSPGQGPRWPSVSSCLPPWCPQHLARGTSMVPSTYMGNGGWGCGFWALVSQVPEKGGVLSIRPLPWLLCALFQKGAHLSFPQACWPHTHTREGQQAHVGPSNCSLLRGAEGNLSPKRMIHLRRCFRRVWGFLWPQILAFLLLGTFPKTFCPGALLRAGT